MPAPAAAASPGQHFTPREQHQPFLPSDQPFTQLAKAELQSYCAAGTSASCPQPLPCCEQHHCFFWVDQSACQLASPSAQLKGSTGPLAGFGAALCCGRGHEIKPFAQQRMVLSIDQWYWYVSLWSKHSSGVGQRR